MCFDLLWNTRLLVIAIVDILSQNIVVGSSCLCWRSINIHQSQTTSQVALVVAMYSASVDDNVIIARFLDDHEITLDPSWNLQRLGWKNRWPNKHKFQLGSKVISWSSKKLATIALSSVVAEYNVGTSAACKAVWLRRILIDHQHKQEEPTTMFCDNTSTIAMTKNSVFHNIMKHIEIRHHYICELVDKKEIELQFWNTRKQLANIFTKPITTEWFIEFRR